MKRVDVFSLAGEKIRVVELNEEIFSVAPNDHVEYLYMKAYLANQRQGTHKSKQRSEIAGSTRKLHKQKGTGGSRKGDIKNPLFKGGGRVFGPLPRDYSISLNKKTRALARFSALSRKAASDDIRILEDITFPDYKTKNFVNLLACLGFEDARKVVFVVSGFRDNVFLASRNIPNISVVSYKSLNAYDVARFDLLVFEESALIRFQDLLLRR